MSFINRFSIILISCALAFGIYSCSDSTTGPETDDPVAFDHKMAPGDSAESFLEGDQYTTLRVEIDYIKGYQPTQEGLNSLRSIFAGAT
ncbi:MAG: hypothetical protein U5J63_06725 [Fodinibius sp.]|nr:hypothetical protein [Fodinibius sp.]